MSFDLVKKFRAKLRENKKVDYSDDHKAHPDHSFNLYSEEFIKYDRVTDTWENIKEKLLELSRHSEYQPFDTTSKKTRRAVLLMHERAFRLGGNNSTSEAEKLEALIIELKALGFKFDTLDNY